MKSEERRAKGRSAAGERQAASRPRPRPGEMMLSGDRKAEEERRDQEMQERVAQFRGKRALIRCLERCLEPELTCRSVLDVAAGRLLCLPFELHHRRDVLAQSRLDMAGPSRIDHRVAAGDGTEQQKRHRGRAGSAPSADFRANRSGPHG